MHSRRSPVEHSESSLASRDYQPRHGGPELITSWPLGPAPAQTEPGDVDWEVAGTGVTIQKNTFTLPYLGGIDYAPIYLNAVGHASVSGESLSLTLAATHVSGPAQETTVELRNDEREPFTTSMIELTPETVDGEHPDYTIESKIYGGYELGADVPGGVAHLDQGTAVQLWSE